MGSWYNTIGRLTVNTDDKQTCIIKKCGTPPANILGQEFREWNKCALQYDGFCSKTVVAETPNNSTIGINLNVEEKEEQQTSGNGLSTNMKIGLAVGALAVIGLVMFFRRK